MAAITLSMNTPVVVQPSAAPSSGSSDIADYCRVIEEAGDEYSKTLTDVNRLKKECELAARMRDALKIGEKEDRYTTMAGLSPSLCLKSYDRAFGEIKTGLRISQGVFAGASTAALGACIPSFLASGNPVMTALSIAGGLIFVNYLAVKGLIPRFFDDFIIPPRLDRALDDEVKKFSSIHEKELESAQAKLKDIESRVPDVSKKVTQDEVIVEDPDFVSIDGIKLKKKSWLFQRAIENVKREQAQTSS